MRIPASSLTLNLVSLLLVHLSPSASEDMVFTRILHHPEEDLFVSFGNVWGKQATLPHYNNKNVKLREVSDGSRVISAIYLNDVLEDCEVGRNKKESIALRFEIESMMSQAGNITRLNLERVGSQISWLNFGAFAQECRKKQRLLVKPNSRRRRSLLSSKPRRHSRSKYYYRTRHDRLAVSKYHVKQNLITPGTKWCGPANQARKYTDLGGFWRADKCCRKHDRCDKSISPFSHKYSITNTGPFTMSHCNCDRRFRKCLKLADTGAAKFVGKLFFNFVQTQCFVTRTEKVCSKRNWRGKCQASSYEIVGRLKDNLQF